MSQAELAAPDFSDAYVSLIESGKRNPSPQVIGRLAQKLRCSIHYLEHGVSQAAVATLTIQVRQARAALEANRIGDAAARFAAITASPAFESTPDLHLPVRRGLAQSLETCGLVDEAIEQLQLAAKTAYGDSWEDWASIQVYLCRCYCKNGSPSKAIDVAEHALERLQESGRHGPQETDVWLRVGVALLHAYERRGDRLRTRQWSGQLVRVARRGSPAIRMMVHARAAAIAEAEDEHAIAVELAAQALAAAEHDDGIHPCDDGPATVDLARLLLVRARPSDMLRARALLHRRERQLVELGGNAFEVGICITELARAEFALDHPGPAARHARRAIEVLTDVYAEAVADALVILGQAHIRLDEHDEGVEVLTQCAICLERSGHRRRAAQVWYDVAEALRRSGSDNDQQHLAYRRALSLIGLTEVPQSQPVMRPGSALGKRNFRPGPREAL